MTKLKRWFATAAFTIAGLFGYQVARPPVLEDRTPPIVVVQPSPTPFDMNRAGLVLGKVTNQNGARVTPEQLAIARKSIEKDNQVIVSDCFSDNVFNGHFEETNGLTNGQIFNLIASREIVINIEFFYGSFAQNYIYKTQGYDVGDGTVYANTFYIKDEKDLGSLNLHETGHRLGFHHYSNKNNSIPYQFNNFFDECVE